MKEKEMEVKDKGTPEAPSKAEVTREGTYYTPRVDIFETEKELTLIADIPGVKSDNLDIDIRDNTLTINGKIETEKEREYLLREYGVGNYFRQFTLSEVIDQENINANIKDGVLKLTLPKVEKAKPRKIAIKQ